MPMLWWYLFTALWFAKYGHLADVSAADALIVSDHVANIDRITKLWRIWTARQIRLEIESTDGKPG